MSNIEIQFSSKSNEWYTPSRYIEAVRETLGFIDLDPASCLEANNLIKAKRFFSLENDGLNKDWIAETLFCNPPYGRRNGKSNQKLWSKKLIEEYNNGNIKQAILLVNASTSEKWFENLFNYVICFTNHRIKFYSLEKKSQPTKGNAFIYFGLDSLKFEKCFKKYGSIIQKVKRNV
jgi:phage N-6-adenine-methyltransferase